MGKTQRKESDNSKTKSGGEQPARPDTQHLLAGSQKPTAKNKPKPTGKPADAKDTGAGRNRSVDSASHARNEVYSAKPSAKGKKVEAKPQKPGLLASARETFTGYLNSAVSKAESLGLTRVQESRQKATNKPAESKSGKPADVKQSEPKASKPADSKPVEPKTNKPIDYKPAPSKQPAEPSKSEAPAALTRAQQQRADLIKQTLNTSEAAAEKLVRGMTKEEGQRFDRVSESDNPQLRKRAIEAVTNQTAKRQGDETRAEHTQATPKTEAAKTAAAESKVTDSFQRATSTTRATESIKTSPTADSRPTGTPPKTDNSQPERTQTKPSRPKPDADRTANQEPPAALTEQQQRRAALIKQTLNTNDDNAEKLVRRMTKEEERRFDRVTDTPDPELRKRALESITNSEAQRLGAETRQQRIEPTNKSTEPSERSSTSLPTPPDKSRASSSPETKSLQAPSVPSTSRIEGPTTLTSDQQRRADMIKQHMNTGGANAEKMAREMTTDEARRFDRMSEAADPELRKRALDSALNAQARRLSEEARSQSNDRQSSGTSTESARTKDGSSQFMAGKLGAEENKGFFAAPDSRSATPGTTKATGTESRASTAADQIRDQIKQGAVSPSGSERSPAGPIGGAAGAGAGGAAGSQVERMAGNSQRSAGTDAPGTRTSGAGATSAPPESARSGSTAARGTEGAPAGSNFSHKQFDKSDLAPGKSPATSTPADVRTPGQQAKIDAAQPATTGNTTTPGASLESASTRTSGTSAKPETIAGGTADKSSLRSTQDAPAARAPGSSGKVDALNSSQPADRIMRPGSEASTSAPRIPGQDKPAAADINRISSTPSLQSGPRDLDQSKKQGTPGEPQFNRSPAESRDYFLRTSQKEKDEKEKEEERKRQQWYRLGGVPGPSADKSFDALTQRPADRLRSDLAKMSADPLSAIPIPGKSIRETGDFGRRVDLNIARGLSASDSQPRTFTAGQLPDRTNIPGSNTSQLAANLRNTQDFSVRVQAGDATRGRTPDGLQPGARDTTRGDTRTFTPTNRPPDDARSSTGGNNQSGRIISDTRQPVRSPVDTPAPRRPGDIAAGPRTTGGTSTPGIPGAPGSPPGNISRIIARTPAERREFTGAEIALAAIIAAAGTARVRTDSKLAPAADGEKKDAKSKPLDAAGIKKGDVALRQPLKGDETKVASDVAKSPNQEEAQPETTDDDSAPLPDSPIGYLPEFHIVGEAISLVKKLNPASLLKSEEQADISSNTTDADDPSSTAAATIFTRPTYLVSEEYTLVSLAEELFHDPNVGWLIADLNKDSVKETFVDGKRVIELMSRQEIILPVWQDIVDFYQHRPAEAIPENLVTIVSQSGVDRELLDSSLGIAMGANTSAFPALPAPDKPAFKPLLSRSVSLPDNKVPTLAWLTRTGQSLQTFISKTGINKPGDLKPVSRNLQKTGDFTPPAAPAGP